jgi:hypothetical protein
MPGRFNCTERCSFCSINWWAWSAPILLFMRYGPSVAGCAYRLK